MCLVSDVEHRLLIELAPLTPTVRLANGVGFDLSSRHTNAMRLVPRDLEDWCFYNWIATDKILTGISLTTCNDYLSAQLEGLNLSYIESTRPCGQISIFR